MPAAQDTFTYWRSRLALLIKQQAPDREIAEARSNMIATQLRDHIQAALAKAPELPQSRRRELAELLREGEVR